MKRKNKNEIEQKRHRHITHQHVKQLDQSAALCKVDQKGTLLGLSSTVDGGVCSIDESPFLLLHLLSHALSLHLGQ